MTSLRNLINENFISINVDDIYPFTMDGVTDNSDSMFNFQQDVALKCFPTSTRLTVTLTMGSPGRVNRDKHYLRVGDIVRFWGTGLPTGLVQGKLYWVCYQGMTQGSFLITDTNLWRQFWQSDKYTINYINFTGTQSGTVYMAVMNQGWNIFTWPPGTFWGRDGNWFAKSVAFGSGRGREKHYAYGLEAWSGGLGAGGTVGQTGYNWLDTQHCDRIYNAKRGDTRVQLKDLSKIGVYVPGSYIFIVCANTQDLYGSNQSWPLNASYSEFKKIASVDSTNGYLYFADKDSGQPEFLRHNYFDHFPTLGSWANNIQFPYGAACIIPMPGMFDSEKELYGFRGTDTSGVGEQGGFGRKTRYVDYFFDSQTGKPEPSTCERFIVENCQGTRVEIDKGIEILLITRCPMYSIASESGATDLYQVEHCDTDQMNGTSKNTLIKNNHIEQMVVGPLGFGTTENFTMLSNKIGDIQEATRLDQSPLVPSEYANLICNWTFSGGTLTQPMEQASYAWPTPGIFACLTRHDQSNQGLGVGSPFRVLNMYTKATVRTVTFNVGLSTVIDSTPPANNTTVAFALVSGAFPGGIIPYTPFYVVNSSSGSYQVSTTKGGSPVTLNGTATGSYQSLISPLFCMDTTLDNLPNGDQLISTVSINVSTSTFTWNNDGIGSTPPNGTNIVFKTTGTLPTDTTNGGTIKTQGGYYFTVNQSGNTFKIATSSGGTAISLSGSQSGIHTIVGNALRIKPITCPKITTIGTTGCHTIEDMNNGPPRSLLYSYINRMFIGYIDAQAAYIPDMPTLVGKIVSMTVNVIRPDTSALGTLTVTFSMASYNDDCTKAANMSQVVNLKVAGKRVITQTTISGNQAGDNIVAFPRWVVGGLSPAYSNYSNATQFSQTAKWHLIIQTDQGMYNYPVVHYNPGGGNPVAGGFTLYGNSLYSNIPMVGNSPQ